MLKGRQCRIRPATPEDTDTLADWWSDGAVMEHAGFPDGLTVDRHKMRTGLQRQEEAPDAPSRLYILENSNKEPIGEMNHEIDKDVAEIGIKICEPASQNKGIGKDALKTFIVYLFDERAVETIKLDTMVENTRAQRVYEALGFEKTRVNKDVWTDQKGRKRTSVDYELTKTKYLRHKDFYKSQGDASS